MDKNKKKWDLEPTKGLKKATLSGQKVFKKWELKSVHHPLQEVTVN